MASSEPPPDVEEDDARSVGSFKSADEDDFDPVQDFPVSGAAVAGPTAVAAAAGASSEGALPPGLSGGDGGDVDERWNLRKDGNKDELEPIWSRLLADREHVKISKQLSYVLRHAAHKLDVRIRKDGFVRLGEIRKLRNFKDIALEKLMAVVYFDEKERYTMVREFDGELLIRANQGHTMKVVESDLLLDLVTEPDDIAECVHGTYLVHWPFIKKQGLSKVARNHIHLANGLPEDGKIRGMRSTAELFVYVNIHKAMEDGITFYKSKNDVILTTGIDGWLPVKYFAKAQRIDYNTCDTEEMDFEEEADPPQWAAELAPSGPGDGGSYLVKNLEALISNCKKRLQEINELKASQEAGMELNEEELDKVAKHAQAFTELQSLEQRFRQHKGYRRESAQEKDQRMKDEAEANTVVARKDRAITPPWERGKQNLESVGGKATEKEKAQWAALGRKREEGAGTTPHTKKEDRKEATPSWRGGGGGKDSFSMSEAPSWRGSGGGGGGGGRGEGKGEGKGEGRGEGRGEGGGGKEKKSEEPTDSSAGRPRFFNSKKEGIGTSWRDRMAGSRGDEKEKSDFKSGQPPAEAAAPPTPSKSQQAAPMSPSPEAVPAAPPAQSFTQPPPPPQHEPTGIPQGLALTQIPQNNMGNGGNMGHGGNMGMSSQDMQHMAMPQGMQMQQMDMGGYMQQAMPQGMQMQQLQMGGYMQQAGQYAGYGYAANGMNSQEMHQMAMPQGMQMQPMQMGYMQQAGQYTGYSYAPNGMGSQEMQQMAMPQGMQMQQMQMQGGDRQQQHQPPQQQHQQQHHHQQKNQQASQSQQRDHEWRDSEWRDSDWRDSDWRDQDWRDQEWDSAATKTNSKGGRKAGHNSGYGYAPNGGGGGGKGGKKGGGYNSGGGGGYSGGKGGGGSHHKGGGSHQKGGGGGGGGGGGDDNQDWAALGRLRSGT